MLINRTCPPRESVLQAAEVAMCVALAEANRARSRGDEAGYVRHMARLCALQEQAAEVLRRAA